MSVGTLEYRGNAGVDDMRAFNARSSKFGQGESLFRIYALDGVLYFIRVGGGKTTQRAAAAQFGLLGGLIMYFVQKRAKRKTQETLNTIAGNDPRMLLSSHKYNYTLPVAEIASATILPPSWLVGTVGRLTIVLANGKKRHHVFDDVDNMRSAVSQLPEVLGDKLDVQAEWDDVNKKFRKRI